MWHHLLVIGNPPQVPALLWAVAADTNSWKQHSKSYVITTCIQVPGGLEGDHCGSVATIHAA